MTDRLEELPLGVARAHELPGHLIECGAQLPKLVIAFNGYRHLRISSRQSARRRRQLADRTGKAAREQIRERDRQQHSSESGDQHACEHRPPLGEAQRSGPHQHHLADGGRSRRVEQRATVHVDCPLRGDS